MLLILKIIGIIVLCVLGTAVLALLLLAFAPVSFRILTNGRNADIRADGQAEWLGGLINAKLVYEERNARYRLRLLGVTLKKGEIRDLTGKLKEARLSVGEEQKTEGGAQKKPAPDSFTEKVQKAAEKAGKLRDKYSEIRRILKTRSGRRTTAFLKKQIKELRKKIKPFIIRGRIEYGLEDAAATAILYGVVGSLAYRIAGEELVVLPDFTETGINQDVEMKGRFQAGPVAAVLYKTITDEGVRRMFQTIRRIING